MWVLGSTTCNLPKIVRDCHLRVLNYTSTLTFSMRTTCAHVKLLGIEWCSFHSKLLTSTFCKRKMSLADVISGVSKIHPCSIFSTHQGGNFRNQPQGWVQPFGPLETPTTGKWLRSLGTPWPWAKSWGGRLMVQWWFDLEDIPNIRSISLFGDFYDLRLFESHDYPPEIEHNPCFKGDASHKPITFWYPSQRFRSYVYNIEFEYDTYNVYLIWFFGYSIILVIYADLLFARMPRPRGVPDSRGNIHKGEKKKRRVNHQARNQQVTIGWNSDSWEKKGTFRTYFAYCSHFRFLNACCVNPTAFFAPLRSVLEMSLECKRYATALGPSGTSTHNSWNGTAQLCFW